MAQNNQLGGGSNFSLKQLSKPLDLNSIVTKLNPTNLQIPPPAMPNPLGGLQRGQMEQSFKNRPYAADEQEALLRLQYDFEFIQHLVSPDYVRHLFSKKYFDQPEFLNYLEYLKYFRLPEYQKLLVVPQCLDVLEMLLNVEIRTEIERNPDFSNYFANF